MVRKSAIDQSLSDAIDVKQHLGRLSQLPERAIMTASSSSSVVVGGKLRKRRIFA